MISMMTSKVGVAHRSVRQPAGIVVHLAVAAGSAPFYMQGLGQERSAGNGLKG